MNLLNIDGQLLKDMFNSAANSLENNKSTVNALNVFPVPDGDTGTNMSMTLMSAVKEIQKAKGHTAEEIAEAAANGSLMGARGNSGVILSQILRGFSKGVKGKSILDSKALAAALKEGANTAYKAIMKPTEGTILTVAREIADKAVELSKTIDDINILMDRIVLHGENILNKTPEMLPVLKKAGVVDAGGKGLIYIYKGMIEALKGNVVVLKEAIETKESDTGEAIKGAGLEEEIQFGYCTEFIIKSADADIKGFRELLSAMGDSLIVVGGSGVVKVHIHTNDPGKVLTKALELGELSNIKIDNMREQHRSIINQEGKDEDSYQEIAETDASPAKKSGVITVAMGEGIKKIFLDLGADVVIEGGQTMNPSTEDILKAIKSINAEDIYILPNNGNIVMAAKQASNLTDKNVVVIPTKSIPQGIAALTVFNPEGETAENTEAMTSSLDYVKTGQVTYAVRNTSFDGREIREGDILGLINGKINNTGKEVLDVTEALIDSMVSESDELITILYGSDINKEDADALAEKARNKYTDCDVQLYYGGQPLYYFIISVE